MEDSFVVMRDRAGLTVHQVRSTNHFPSESRANGLMSQANPKDRNLPGEVPDQIAKLEFECTVPNFCRMGSCLFH